MGKHNKGGSAPKHHDSNSNASDGKKSGAGAAGVAGGGASGAFSLELREGCVALLRFRSRDGMNALLDPLSNAAEGVIANRLGHNFALVEGDRLHAQFRKAAGIPKQARYLIATLEGDAHSIRHEMCHARFHLQPEYRDTVRQVWAECLSAPQRDSVTSFLTRLKYDAVVHLDEWQAYLVTEKPNFFGMDLSEAQQALAASFPPGSWR